MQGNLHTIRACRLRLGSRERRFGQLSARGKMGRLGRIRYRAVAAQSREALPDHSDDLFQLRGGVRPVGFRRKGHACASAASKAIPNIPAAAGSNCAKGPATLNQVTDPERIRYPLEAGRQARRRKMGTRDLGRSSRRHRRRACAKRCKKSGATRSCITSAGPAMSCFIISGFFTPGASTATTATPTSVPPARAPAMHFGRASTGRRRIMPTRASFCC